MHEKFHMTHIPDNTHKFLADTSWLLNSMQFAEYESSNERLAIANVRIRINNKVI